MNDARNPVKSVQTSLEIVETIKEHDEIGVTELAEEVGLTKGTVHCHLATLENDGYVVNTNGRYRLGLRFVDIAHHVRRRVPIYDIVTEEVEKLAEKSGELTLFTVEEQREGVCLYKASGENAVQTELYVGYRNELHHTAVGKAILAFKSQEEIDEILAGMDLQSLTDETITDERELREELEEIRKRGLAYNRGETIPGLVGVGAPIRDHDDDVHGAIAIIGPTSRMNDRLDEFSEMLNHAVNVIEINATSL
ncbi:IclR family transcriptional regulator [halophilic archaeon]|nr:IclR family transcriptional regulator [halophilic archaeon]